MKASKKPPGQVRVPVCDRMIEVVTTDDSKSLVSAESVCAALGMDYTGQLAKLRSPDCDWATILIRRGVAADGTCRELEMVDMESLPLWLVMTEPGEVAPEFRPGLVQFQEEAMTVLSAWFPTTTFDWLTSGPKPADREGPGTAQGRWRARMRSGLVFLRSISGQQDKVYEFEAASRPLGQRRDHEYMTLREFCDLHALTNSQGRPLSDEELAEIESTLDAMSAVLNIPVKKVQAKRAP